MSSWISERRSGNETMVRKSQEEGVFLLDLYFLFLVPVKELKS